MSLEVIDDASTEMPASTPAPEVTTEATPAPEVTPGEGPAATAPVAQPVAPVAPAYQPNFKYSVKGQEKEIDEMFRALIKDAESEKKIKDLFEKADGIDFVKQDRDSLKSEYKGFKDQVVPYLQEYHKFTTLRDKGDLGAALQVAGISDDTLAEYLYNKLMAEQNPQQAQLLKQKTESSLKEFEMQGQLQRYQQMEQQIQQQQAEFNLNQAMAPHKEVISKLEQAWGSPGQFREEVFMYGISQEKRGVVVTEQQAVEAVINKFKPFLAANEPQTPSTIAQPHVAPAVIPSAGSASISPVMQKPKSIEDLKKLRAEAV